MVPLSLRLSGSSRRRILEITAVAGITTSLESGNMDYPFYYIYTSMCFAYRWRLTPADIGSVFLKVLYQSEEGSDVMLPSRQSFHFDCWAIPYCSLASVQPTFPADKGSFRYYIMDWRPKQSAAWRREMGYPFSFFGPLSYTLPGDFRCLHEICGLPASTSRSGRRWRKNAGGRKSTSS